MVQLSASDLYRLYRPSECELRVWLAARHEVAGAPAPFAELLYRLGREHEARHRRELEPVLDLSRGTPASRRARTRAAIEEKVPVVYQGRLEASLKLDEGEFTVVGEPDFLVRVEGGYAIRDAKLARRLGERDNPAIVRQLQLYGWLFQRNFGRPPARLEVFSALGTVEPIPDEGGKAALADLARMARLVGARRPPVEPVGFSKCLGCDFREHCYPPAVARRDVAVVRGVDQSLARELYSRGIKSARDLIEELDLDQLRELKRKKGGRAPRVGKAAATILASARALEAGRPIVLTPPALPAGDDFVVFDLEGIPPHVEGIERVYLWGFQVFGARPGTHQVALAAPGDAGDARAWRRFLALAAGVIEERGPIPWLHWHHYERDKLAKYAERYGDPDGIAARVRGLLVDLLPVTEASVALPLPSLSLKVVEEYVGYRRSQDEYGGDWAIAKYVEAVETEDEAGRKAILDKVVRYNREDLEATWAVFAWLRTLAGGGA